MPVDACLPSLLTLFPLAVQDGAGPAQAPAAPSMWIVMLAVFAIFYLVAFLPEKKARKRKEAMLAAIKKNDKVLTTGGMFATVAALSDTDVTIKFDDGPTRVRVLRSAIASVLDADGAEAQG